MLKTKRKKTICQFSYIIHFDFNYIYLVYKIFLYFTGKPDSNTGYEDD